MDSIKSAAILRDFLNFRSWRHQKRSNSARLPQFPKLATSDTKQFRETSFKNGKLSAELTPLRVFQLRLPRKSYARSYEVLHLSRKIILTNLKIWCSKMQSLSGNQRADLLRSLMKMSFVLRLPREMHLCRSSSKCSRPETATNPHVLLIFYKVQNPLHLPRKNDIWTAKSGPNILFFTSWLGNVLRATTTCTFFDISTSKSAPRLRFFSHLNFETCFPPQRRTLFEYLNFQKRSERRVFCAFWLENVLRAKTACNFSTSQLPKVLQTCQFFITFDFEVSFAPQRHTLSRQSETSKSARYPVCFVHCASRHNDVDFLNVLTAKSALNVVCFAHFDLEMCFAPQRLSLSWHLNFEKCSEPGVFCTLCFTPQTA